MNKGGEKRPLATESGKDISRKEVREAGGRLMEVYGETGLM